MNNKIKNSLCVAIIGFTLSGCALQETIATVQDKLAPLTNQAAPERAKNLPAHPADRALSGTDKLCEILVEPFTLASNLEILAALSKSSMMRGGITHKNSLLEQARDAARQLNWLPIDLEIEYGQQMHDKRVSGDLKLLKINSKRSSIKEQYKRAEEILANLLKSVTAPHPYKFKLFLVNDETINAEAIPGGFIYLNTGALKNGQAEFVLAHEIAHVLKRHTTKEMQSRLIDSVETYEDLKRLLQRRGDVAALTKSISFAKDFLNFSKYQELQSDACSVRVVAEVEGINFNEAVKQHAENLKGDESGQPKERLFGYSEHPKFQERADTIYKVAKLIKE